MKISGSFGSRQSTPNGYGNRDIQSPQSQNDTDYKYGRFDASALHIAHALKQTEIQKAYNKAREKPIDFYLVSENVFIIIMNYIYCLNFALFFLFFFIFHTSLRLKSFVFFNFC